MYGIKSLFSFSNYLAAGQAVAYQGVHGSSIGLCLIQSHRQDRKFGDMAIMAYMSLQFSQRRGCLQRRIFGVSICCEHTVAAYPASVKIPSLFKRHRGESRIQIRWSGIRENTAVSRKCDRHKVGAIATHPVDYPLGHRRLRASRQYLFRHGLRLFCRNTGGCRGCTSARTQPQRRHCQYGEYAFHI